MRHALRSLRRDPSFAAIAVLTLAIGIGTTTTIFAIVDELIFKPSRGGDPSVYALGELMIPDYETLSAAPPAGVMAVAAYEFGGGGLMQMPGRAERVVGWRVSGRYADVKQVRTQAGRWIADEDNIGGEPDAPLTINGTSRPRVLGTLGADVVVISDRIWREWFGASPEAVGQLVTLNQRPTRVVGVAPRDFEPGIDVWTPFGRRRLLTAEELDRQRRAKRPVGWAGPPSEPRQPGVFAWLRLDRDASVEQVSARVNGAIANRPPSSDMPVSRVRLVPRSRDTRQLRTGYVILGFAALIFVAACANLANMLFARAAEREGELAVRLSLGAGRFAIFWLLAAETLLICVAASAAGLAIATGALRLFSQAVPAFPVSSWRRVALDLTPDWRVFGFAAAAGCAAALFIGAASLWRSNRVSLLTRLAASGAAVVAKTEARTLRTMLVSVQVTAAVLLLIATGMLLENSSRRLNRRLWFDTSELVSARVELPDTYDASRGTHFFAQAVSELRAAAGVTAAAVADALPGGEAPAPRRGVSAIAAEPPARGWSGVPVRINGQWIAASPDFPRTLGLSIVRGRDFREDEAAGVEPVAIVSVSAARRLWPGTDPIGKRLACCGGASWRRVIGVVADPIGTVDRPATQDLGEALQEALGDTGAGVFVFLPAAQDYHASMLIVLRGDSSRAVVLSLGRTIAALDPTVPVFEAGPVNASQFARASGERGVRVLAGALGFTALGIAVCGVYAVVSYFVSRRSREFGLRLALGSTRRQVGRLVIDYAIHIVLIGLLPGVLFASWGTRYFESELRDLHPNGITMWIAVPILMLAAGVIAAWIPARRAARVDPYQSLKDL